jgi:hypothetical protein
MFRSNFVCLCSVRRLLITAYVPSSVILVTLMMEALRSSETSVLTTTTLRNMPEDAIRHSRRCENLKSYLRLCKFLRILHYKNRMFLFSRT